jgi:adenosylmethionine-8-amino-7-oxononanoate aminotransferase
MLTNDQLAKWDRDSFLHPSTHLAQHARGETATRIIKSAEGSFITDRDGNRFLDAFAGLYCVNIGYGRQEVAEAIADQARELAYYHAYVGHGTEASVTLAQMVMDRAPDHMSRVYFGLGGSDANETNVKLVWYYNNILGRPEKKKIISRWRGYHGSGLMSGSLTGLSMFGTRSSTCRSTPSATPGALLLQTRGCLPDRGRVHRPMRRRSGGADRRRGPRHHRRLHRGADAGHGRYRSPARGLLGRPSSPSCASTTSC